MLYNRSEISKIVSWDSEPIPIPDMKVIDLLYYKAVFKKCKNSAIKIFQYYRFCVSPRNTDELLVINGISDILHMIFK